ncbi:MAG: hypothetical protein MR008_01300 [Aerococcus sp.]|nr:hypothetical protein [Aerococcus sp.]
MKVTNYVELQKALDSDEKTIELVNSINAVNSITLGVGQKLTATHDNVLLSFINGDGIVLRGDNEISNLAIQTAPNRRAIYIDSPEVDLKTITLNNLTVTGMVQLLTRGNNKQLTVDIDGLDIIAADARNYSERPMKYGVIVYQGALTIYNFNPADDSHITVNAENISMGRPNAPVIGSGVFISGFDDNTGKVTVEKLTTNDIYTNGMIPSGQPNLITGAIFIVFGAHAKEVISHGEVTTYGTNDMVLDVWGTVDHWVTEKRVISYGPNGIGFVNFGYVKDFEAKDSIETYGQGARGFNQYDGTIDTASFKRIQTVGNGSIGMQFSKRVGKITIEDGVFTEGSVGETLVKGVIKVLKADAISVLEGGKIAELNILGDLVTKGEDVVAYHVNGGEVDTLSLKGKLSVNGDKSQPVVIENDGKSDSSGLEDYLK